MGKQVARASVRTQATAAEHILWNLIQKLFVDGTGESYELIYEFTVSNEQTLRSHVHENGVLYLPQDYVARMWQAH